MFKTVLKGLAGVGLGLGVAVLLAVGVEAFSAVVHPFPGDFQGTMDEVCRHVEKYPGWVLAAVVPMWAAAALAATWVAGKVGGVVPGGAVGLLLVAGVAFNVAKLPYPAWFKAACLVAIPAAAVAGSWLGRRRAARVAVAA